MKKGDSVFKIVISVAIFISLAVIGFYFINLPKSRYLQITVYGGSLATTSVGR